MIKNLENTKNTSRLNRTQFSIVIVTQNDIFYIPEFFIKFLQKASSSKLTISLIIILPPFNESLIKLIKRMYLFYGLVGFFRQGIRYVVLRLLDKIGFKKCSIQNIAKQYGIPVKNAKNINGKEIINELRDIAPDVILSVSASQIFKKEVLDIPKWGCINIHSARLPKYRGMMPNFWAMYHGDATAGITIHTMDEKIDRGKIILQTEIPIYPEESLDSLIRRSKRVAADLAIQALEQIRDGKAELRDYEGKGSYFSFPTRKHVRQLRARGYRLL